MSHLDGFIQLIALRELAAASAPPHVNPTTTHAWIVTDACVRGAGRAVAEHAPERVGEYLQRARHAVLVELGL
ncbi:MAG: hypothetical protein HZA24_00305 [Nitrospirae bacterium]|nr:hypothetical protein [Nitrospirota bacterium]